MIPRYACVRTYECTDELRIGRDGLVKEHLFLVVFQNLLVAIHLHRSKCVTGRI
jgi:hypothetical protein